MNNGQLDGKRRPKSDSTRRTDNNVCNSSFPHHHRRRRPASVCPANQPTTAPTSHSLTLPFRNIPPRHSSLVVSSSPRLIFLPFSGPCPSSSLLFAKSTLSMDNVDGENVFVDGSSDSFAPIMPHLSLPGHFTKQCKTQYD